MARTLFGKYPPAEWRAEGRPPVRFPFINITEDYENRLVPHERAYRDGARIDDTGSKATVWTLTAIFFNAPHHEEGIDGESLYPDVVNELAASFKVHETGTLIVPTVGQRRCRAHRYQRTENHNEVDFCTVSLTFMEDNEDDAESAATQYPLASSVVRLQADESVDAVEEQGATSFDLSQLNEFAAGLEALATGPGDFISDLEEQAFAVANITERVVNTFSSEAAEAEAEIATLLTDPASSRAGMALARLADTAHRIVADRYSHEGRIVTRHFERPMSLFDVCTRLNQLPHELAAINTHIANLLHIPAGTPVRVYER